MWHSPLVLGAGAASDGSLKELLASLALGTAPKSLPKSREDISTTDVTSGHHEPEAIVPFRSVAGAVDLVTRGPSC